MYAEIILKNKSKMTNRIYTYKIPEKLIKDINIGIRVIVPFGKGNNKRMGIITKIKSTTKVKGLKEIIELLDDIPILDEEQIKLAFFMVDNYLSDLSSAFQTVLPPGNWGDIVEYFYLNDKYEKKSFIDDKYKDLILFLEKEKKSWLEIKSKFKSNISHLELINLVKYGVLKSEYDIINRTRKKVIKVVNLVGTFDINKIQRNAKLQIAVMNLLTKIKSIDYKKLLTITKANSATIKTLEKKGALYITEKKVYREILDDYKDYSKSILNFEQEYAYDTIINSEHHKFLLHGITGSGKTEIYLHVVEHCLKNNKDAIILVPEIALTPQTIERFSGRFQGLVAVLHSKLSLNERFDQWRMIKNGKYKVVVGARSAIFAPLKNLGAIIIDEEHETSYISEKNPKYNTIEIANFRSDYNKGSKLILGSATPSVDDYYDAKKRKYKILELNKRATKNSLPSIKKIDMREELKLGNRSMLSRELHDKIKDRLKKKEQIILFLNKRGHTSYVFCRNCGFVYTCSHCNVSMTYHKYKNKLICHLCGRTNNKSDNCPNCGSSAIREFGAGTEKLEEITRNFFPEANIFRMDRDTISNKDSYNKLYEKMKNNEIDILIGTQMISKGLDFANVTLVGVIAADISLNFGDFKSAERTFQLLTQVSGRAGRGDKKGEVYIQTYKPENYAIESSVQQNFKDFYDIEINKRKLYKYPPFYRMININISNYNKSNTRIMAMKINKFIQNELNLEKINSVQIIGPKPSPIDKINNLYRYDLIYKFKPDNKKIIKIINKIINDNVKNIDYSNYRVNITIDPISFF